jgi:hypothetical protein
MTGAGVVVIGFCCARSGLLLSEELTPRVGRVFLCGYNETDEPGEA